MSWRFVRFLVVPVAAGAMLCLPAAAATKGHVHFLGGNYMLNDEDDTEPLEDLTQIGVELSIAPEKSPVMVAVDLLFATGDESQFQGGAGFSADFDIELDVVELAVGVRKIWGEKATRPFIGGGLGFVKADATFDVTIQGLPGGDLSFDENEEDDELGLWAQGGVFWRIGSRFELGGQIRYNTAEVEVADEEIDIGGLEYGIILGWGWP